MKLKIRKESDKEYWIILPEGGECGPYNSKHDAVEAREGLERFYNEENNE